MFFKNQTRISTTVDTDLLGDARKTGAGSNDAELVDAALAALLDRAVRYRQSGYTLASSPRFPPR